MSQLNSTFIIIKLKYSFLKFYGSNSHNLYSFIRGVVQFSFVTF